MICRSTLQKIESHNHDRNQWEFSSKAMRDFFGDRKPIQQLTFTRGDFFEKGKDFSRGISISGVQQKLSLCINDNNEFEIVTVNGTYILKPSPEVFPYAAENEQCAMALSHVMEIDTAFSANIPFADGEEAYITKRYDRVDGIKLPQEDLAQAFGLSPDDKYSKSYEEALILSRQITGGKLSVVRDLFNRIVFAYLIGNDDMHLKNISFIKDPENRTLYYDRLTPNYDQLLVHAFPNPPAFGFLALDLFREEGEGIYSDMYNKYGFYTGHDFYQLGERVGLRKSVVDTLFKNYFEKENLMFEIVSNSFMPTEMKERAAGVIRDRLKAIKIS